MTTVKLKYEVEVEVMEHVAEELRGPLMRILGNSMKPYTEGQKVTDIEAIERMKA